MFPPNINPETYSFSAVLIAALIYPEFTIDEANTIGNWLVLAGDYLITCAGQATLIQNRQIPNTDNQNNQPNNSLESIEEALQKMASELEKLRNSM